MKISKVLETFDLFKTILIQNRFLNFKRSMICRHKILPADQPGYFINTLASPKKPLTRACSQLTGYLIRGNFKQQYPPEIQWINGGDSYIVNEPSAKDPSREDLVKYETSSQLRSIYVPAERLIPEGGSSPLSIENFTFSPDESKVLVFTNSSRVWRSNSKG